MKNIESILVGIALLFLGLSILVPYFHVLQSIHLATQMVAVVFVIVSGLMMISKGSNTKSNSKTALLIQLKRICDKIALSNLRESGLCQERP